MPLLEPIDHVVASVSLNDECLVVEMHALDGTRLLVFLDEAFWFTTGGVGCRVGTLRVTDVGAVNSAIRALFSPEDVTEVDWALSRQLDLLDKETGRVVLSAVGEDWSLTKSDYNPGGW